MNDGVAHSKNPRKLRVSRDLWPWPWPWPWAHPGCTLTWSPSCKSLVAIRPFACEKKRFAQKFTDGRTDRRRTPRHCISSFLEWAKKTETKSLTKKLDQCYSSLCQQNRVQVRPLCLTKISLHSHDRRRCSSQLVLHVNMMLQIAYITLTRKLLGGSSPWWTAMGRRQPGASIPQQPWLYSPILTSSPLFCRPPLGNNFWTLYTQFCAIYACFLWFLEAVSQG